MIDMPYKKVEVSMSNDELLSLNHAVYCENEKMLPYLILDLLTQVLPRDIIESLEVKDLGNVDALLEKYGLEVVLLTNGVCDGYYVVLDEVDHRDEKSDTMALHMVESMIADRVAKKIDLGEVSKEYRYAMTGPDVHREWLVEIGLNFSSTSDISDQLKDTSDVVEAVGRWLDKFESDPGKTAKLYRGVGQAWQLHVVVYTDGMKKGEAERIVAALGRLRKVEVGVDQIFRPKDIMFS